jgi:alpha-tubulin suppressor-like RCC1 family protein
MTRLVVLGNSQLEANDTPAKNKHPSIRCYTLSVGVKQVCCGDTHVLLLSGEILCPSCWLCLNDCDVSSVAEGGAWSFGSNEWGQLGLGKDAVVSQPRKIQGRQRNCRKRVVA